MRAVLPFDPDHPEPRLGDVPEPGFSVSDHADQVLLAVEAAGLNRADLLQVRGHYPPPPGESEIPGLECAGVVEAVGEAVSGLAPGDRVMALLAGGGQAERVRVPAGQVMALPSNLSFVEGAALPEACLTAWTNLVAEGKLVDGETVLVTGANGGVGTMTVQLARALGARVLAAGRSRERLEPVAALGADALVIDDENLAEAVGDATDGRGVDLVIDLVGGEGFDRRLACLRRRGRLVLLGVVAGGRATVDLAAVLRRRLSVVGSVLRARSRAEKAELVRGFARFGLPRLAEGTLVPVVDRVMALDEAPAAYTAMASGGHVGKIVLRVGG